jgi:AraC-like DNA-binding protein
LEVTELAGVTLIWSQAEARARWRDEMTGNKLHIGFAIECAGTITARGQSLGADVAQAWIPGEEMDLILDGPNLTLDLAVEAELVDKLGWQVAGDPVRRVPRDALRRLLRTCQRASAAMRFAPTEPLNAAAAGVAELWRDQVLDELEPVLRPWLTQVDSDQSSLPTATIHYELIRRADDALDALSDGIPFTVDELAESLDVPRRTLFTAYRSLLRIGPREYLELKRLHRLRYLLKRADRGAVTVTTLAAELGFGDMGRLAKRYRSLFGENPSETTKRARSSFA